PAEQRGRNFVTTNCSRCHSVDKVTPSPLKIAPPFRDLHLKYPIETLQESLAEGIYTGHPTMPALTLEPDQINDVLSYLKSLEELSPPLQRLHRPGDQILCDGGECLVECRDHGNRIDL